MEEETVINGVNETETDPSEKILKPRKPKTMFVGSKEHITVIQNGNSESSSVSDVIENYEIKNGHDEDSTEQNGNESLLEENVEESKESIPRKLRRESKKESTPKPETPMKRELRRRETTPRVSTPKKNLEPNPSSEKLIDISESQIKEDHGINEKTNNMNQSNKIKSQERSEPGESIIILEETTEEIISINESKEDKDPDTAERCASTFPIFNYNSKSSVEIKDDVEASTSSPSIICVDSPSYNNSSLPNKEIKGRKPINSCSKFPGRTVSIISLDSSTKRKADDDSFDNSVKKRFAGDIESGSEKSPGWRFFSSSWSPTQRPPKPPQSSTPFNKHAEEEDSMAVNYNEDTNLSFAISDVKETPSPKTEPGKWCNIM